MTHHQPSPPKKKVYDADDNYGCSRCRQLTRDCTMHYIKASTMEKMIPTAIREVSAYVDHWPEAFKQNIGLLLFGDVGTGKSFAAGCVANSLLDQNIPVLMTNFPSILDRLGDYDLLIIDDLGVERSTGYAMEQMFSIVDSRYRSGKPLIVTTNLKLDELKHPPDLAHARIYDRILERCAPILFAGKNFREDNAASTKAAAAP